MRERCYEGAAAFIEEDVIIAKMDQPLSDDPLGQAHIKEEWENSIHWYPMDFPKTSEEEGYSVTALEDLLNDCELIDCSSK